MITESELNDILTHPFDRDWTIQGFGMLRTYLDTEQIKRLHIWDIDAAVDDVSTIHDHPWDFKSLIVRGAIENIRYELTPAQDNQPADYMSARIVCGIGGHMDSAPIRTRVREASIEHYYPGDLYAMNAPEFHESNPAKGAVTVIERKFHAERDIATVCWLGDKWVTAEPRPATKDEIMRFVDLAKASAG